MDREEIIQKLTELLDHKYFLRWVDHKTTLGDFSGRDWAIDVFNVPVKKKHELYRLTGDFRTVLYRKYGISVMLISHTPEATEEFYSHLVPDSCSE